MATTTTTTTTAVGNVEEEDSMWQMLVVLVVIMAVTMLLLRTYQDENLGIGRSAPVNAAARANQLQRQAAARAGSSATGSFQPSTSQLSATQLKLHRVLPLQNGALRTITICLDALTLVKDQEIFWEDDLIANSLSDLAQIADVYLLCRVTGEEDQAQWQQFLSHQHGLKHAPPAQRGIPAHKLLYHTTTVGKTAFVRQLEPQFHVEVEPEAAKILQPHVPRILFVETASERAKSGPAWPKPGFEAENVHVAESFSGYLKLLMA